MLNYIIVGHFHAVSPVSAAKVTVAMEMHLSAINGFI